MAKLVKRCEKMAYYGVPNGDGYTFTKMTGFTEMAVTKNPSEYSRQYVDEEFSQTDITGYSMSVSYEFDRYMDDPVHDDIIAITDDELIGTDAVRPIIMVDLTDEADGRYSAVMRDFSIIPDSEGGSNDAYTYSGSFKVKGKKITGVAEISEDKQTLTFTEM
ncbi:MAG: hypothetical protein PHE51_05510 [Eubacteriales bacterium]|nr:hypothetical protein [Eubacteriales bacterium]